MPELTQHPREALRQKGTCHQLDPQLQVSMPMTSLILPDQHSEGLILAESPRFAGEHQPCPEEPGSIIFNSVILR